MTKKLSESSWRLLDTNLRGFRTSQNDLVQGQKFNTAFSMASPFFSLTDCCITIAFTNLKYDLRLWGVLQHPWWKVRKQNFALKKKKQTKKKKKYSQSVLKKAHFKSRKSVCNFSFWLTGFCFVSGQLKSDNFVYGSCELGEHQFMRAWTELRLLSVHMLCDN